MYKILILPVAKQDIREAAVWYSEQQDGLGKRFITDVRKNIKLLKNKPYLHAIRYDDVRASVLPVFPFMVHYSVDESQKSIIIYAVLHTSRNPDMWKTDRDNPEVID